MPVNSSYYNVNTITLHVKEAGDNNAPAILFLHGFPSFWYSWLPQIEYFASQNYHVIVPDQRGYNESSKPNSIADYRLSQLAEDMVQLLAVMKVKQAFIVAHDWGGIVAWSLLKKHPQLFLKAVIINAPYLPSYSKPAFKQLRKSWYVYFFQLPRLTEWLIQRHDFALLTSMMQRSSLPKTFSEEDLALYKQAWRKKGSVTAMVNWYRALARHRSDAKEIFGKRTPIEVPVLVLWGMKDAFLERESGICPPKHCAYFSIKEYEDATHWLPSERSEDVNEDIRQFFSS